MLNGHELGQALGDGEGQGGLAHCSPQGRTRLGDRTTAKLTDLFRNLEICISDTSSKEKLILITSLWEVEEYSEVLKVRGGKP